MKKVSEKNYSNKGNIEVIKLITKNNSMILDIGCGVGDNARILKTEGHIIDGITLSNEEAKLAESYLKNVYIHNLENGLPTLNTKYDYIICSHVLEHISYPEKLFLDLKKIMDQDTILIIAIPNLLHYKSRIELLKGNFNYQETGVWDYTHVRWYTYKSMQDTLIKNGFTILSSSVSGEMPFSSYLNFLSPKIRNYLYNFFTKISKGFFGGQLIYKISLN